MNTIFYRRHEPTGRFECRWEDRNGIDRRQWVAETSWQNFIRQWVAYGYTFIESDFTNDDPQDRR